ncbi:hypothetical protein [Dysgonomonas sp. HDW5B]|uniref:hypothetical protein n=1 Tax=Dysgonomonas sp. HDW5B TaxID=2714927 RepID=UPI002107B06C|nr:hypothetical protein [Dysgonomonas sp. HDW5B]
MFLLHHGRSVGRLFSQFLQDKNSEFYTRRSKYPHTFPDGRVLPAYIYHIDALPMFIRFINEDWIPNHAQRYFKDKDSLALNYLPKLLGK